MKATDIFNSNYQRAQDFLKKKSSSPLAQLDDAIFKELMDQEISFFEDHNLTAADFDEIKEGYIRISEYINKTGKSWDNIIIALEKEYKYIEADKKGIRYSRTGENELEPFSHIFQKIPMDQATTMFAKFRAAENNYENVNFLNFNIYHTSESKTKKTENAPSRKEQVMTIYYLMKACGVSLGQIDKSRLAYFIHFLAGDAAPTSIDGSTIYKELKKLNTAQEKRQNEVITSIINQIRPIADQDSSGTFQKAIELLTQVRKKSKNRD